MVKFEHLEYKQLSKSSKAKISNTLERLDKAGITVKEAKALSDSDLKNALGITRMKKASLIGLRKNIRQITFSQEHRKESANIVIKKYKAFGFKGIKLKQLEKDLTKTAGSSFISISQELEKIGYTGKDKEGKNLSWKRAEFLLKIPKDKYDVIPQKERDILADFGT